MASIFKAPGLDRLGLSHMISDHQATLYRTDQQNVRHRRVADYVVLWGTPAAVFALALFCGWQMQDTGPILNGVAILAGGLFGLLALIFGLQSLGSASFKPAVATLLKETRANVSYATGLCLLIVGALMVTEAFRVDEVRPPVSRSAADVAAGVAAASPFNPVATGLILAALVHLGLVLLMVLNRIRLVFGKL